jgi:adenosylcobinamide kinase/adenosylcobinamide-phosphate guanylyltransferase
VAVILIGGGARSGKSRYGLELARQRGRTLAFLATAQAHDAEMEARIAQHRSERGPGFATIEEPYELGAAIQNAKYDVILVDCLTLWLSNIMLSVGRQVDADIDSMLSAALKSTATVILVTNEVGCGIVPDNRLGREFRDRAGVLNQRAAEAAAEVYWMIFGQPLKVK